MIVCSYTVLDPLVGMGDSWNAVLQGLMIGIAIQVTGSVLYVILTSLCKSMKERLSRPPGGESVDLERGSVNGGEGEAALFL
jgi:hypothetical protein